MLMILIYSSLCPLLSLLMNSGTSCSGQITMIINHCKTKDPAQCDFTSFYRLMMLKLLPARSKKLFRSCSESGSKIILGLIRMPITYSHFAVIEYFLLKRFVTRDVLAVKYLFHTVFQAIIVTGILYALSWHVSGMKNCLGG